jgi:hypothetical protein
LNLDEEWKCNESLNYQLTFVLFFAMILSSCVDLLKEYMQAA